MANRFKGRDFLEIRAECIAFLKERLGERWTDQGESDELLTFVEVIAYLGDTLHFYIDNQKRECDIATAVLFRDVYQKALRDGYKPHICKAAQGVVHVEFSGELENDVLFSRGTVFMTQDDPIVENNIRVTLLEDVTVPAGSTYVDLQVHQGTLVTETHTKADISQFGYIKLSSDRVAEGLTRMSYGGIFWSEVDDVYTDYRTGRIFSVQPFFSRSESTIMVQLPYNWSLYIIDSSPIDVSYLDTLGESGNVASGRITSVTTVIRDVMGNDISGLMTISNPQPISGGAEFESIESIRTSFKDSIRDLSTLVTLDDYEAYARLFTGVDAVAIDWRKAPEVITDPRDVKVLVEVDEEVKEALLESLKERQGRGDNISVDNAIYVEYQIEATIKLSPTGDSEDTITEKIKEELSLLYTTPPQKGNVVYVSKLISVMQNSSDRVLSVTLKSPTEDIIPKSYEIAKYTLVDIKYEVES